MGNSQNMTLFHALFLRTQCDFLIFFDKEKKTRIEHFFQSHSNHFDLIFRKNYGKCLIEASTNSLQSKVLDIIYAYCKNSPDSVELLKKAFEDIPLRMDIDDLISLVCDDFLGNQMLLYHFNNRLLHQHIHSEMVYTLRLGNKVYNCDAVSKSNFR